MAQRLNCYVVAGYPERLSLGEAESHVHIEMSTVLSGEMEIPPDSSASDVPELLGAKGEQPRIQVGANSLALYGPTGEWVGGYRKTNLFETDMTWAKPGV
jgi:protein N-terminal amidase